MSDTQDNVHPIDPSLTEENAAPQQDAAVDTSALEAKLAEANDRMLRALAEVENIRRRSERERQDTAKFAVGGFARDLLSVADNLRRALQAISTEQREQNEALQQIYAGVEATERELLRSFEKNGIRKIEPLDEKFDPNLHEVMFEAEIAGKAPGTIIQLLEPGYVLHERLLRPARVGVAKGGTETGHIDQQV